MEDDRSLHDLLPTGNQKKFMASVPDNELMELLWRNGHVVMHSQTHRKPPANVAEFKQAQKPEPSPKYGVPLGNSSNLMQEDETASWFQFPLDDSLEREFCSEFFCEMPAADATGADKLHKDAATERERELEFGATEESNVFMGSASKHSNPCLHENMMPPPKSHVTGSNQQAPSWRNAGIINFSHFTQPMKADLGSLNGHTGQKTSGNHIQGGMRESSSMTTIGFSACGSNQIQNLVDDIHTFGNEAAEVFTRSMNKDVQTRSGERVQTNNIETTVTSSSGGSGSSFGRTGQQSVSNQSHKRKGRDGEEPECHSEEAEYESVEASKPAQRSASARRSRAAEVHNLSERRRRDRINEKMKALQELIPHCNKSDKASMLDEAIAYLKSLQLQVQIMWMGSAMAPVMFPGVQQYMSHMGMGMAHASMPSIHSPIQLPRVPLVNQSIIPSAPTANHTPACPSPALNPVNFPTQMQNVHLPESYAGYLGFPHMQQPPQAMNLYAFGSHTVQSNQPPPPAGTSGDLPAAGTVPPERTQNGHSVDESVKEFKHYLNFKQPSFRNTFHNVNRLMLASSAHNPGLPPH